MFSGCNRWSLYCVLTFLFLYCIPPLSAISCYVCNSVFPASNICLPPCTQSDQVNSTCQLTQDIPFEASSSGSLLAAHITEGSFLSNALEKNFLFGEEAVYLNRSGAVGWNWEYGAITYGCDTSGCNNPQIVNRLPNTLNASIPEETLNRLLVGELVSTCYQCDTCFDENAPNVNMSACGTTPCPSYSCQFVATRNSVSSLAQCGNAWHFTSGCIQSRESAQVDMTLMYYLRSNTIALYQMEAICLSNTCNNLSTFTQLKDAVTVNPDLTCLVNDTASSTISMTSAPTTAVTTSRSFADYISMNKKLFILLVFFNLYITINI